MGRPHVEHPVRPFFPWGPHLLWTPPPAHRVGLVILLLLLLQNRTCCISTAGWLFLLLPHLLRYWEGVTPKASLKARLNTVEEVNLASMAMTVTGFCLIHQLALHLLLKRTRCLYWEKSSPVTLWNNLDTAAGRGTFSQPFPAATDPCPAKGEQPGRLCPCLCPAFPAGLGKWRNSSCTKSSIHPKRPIPGKAGPLGWCWPKIKLSTRCRSWRYQWPLRALEAHGKPGLGHPLLFGTR